MKVLIEPQGSWVKDALFFSPNKRRTRGNEDTYNNKKIKMFRFSQPNRSDQLINRFYLHINRLARNHILLVYFLFDNKENKLIENLLNQSKVEILVHFTRPTGE